MADDKKKSDTPATVTLVYAGDEPLKLYITSPPLVLEPGENTVLEKHAKRLLKDRELKKVLRLKK